MGINAEYMGKLKRVQKAAFRYCSKLEKVTLPTSLTRIDWVAFWGTQSLKEIDFKRAENIKTIQDFAFGCSGLESVTIPASVTEIGKNDDGSQNAFFCSKIDAQDSSNEEPKWAKKWAEKVAEIDNFAQAVQEYYCKKEG